MAARQLFGTYGTRTGGSTPTAPAPSAIDIYESNIPGIKGLTQSATNIIQSSLDGLPSPDQARLANAYFGAGTGLDSTSEFLRNRGFDLYGMQAQEQKSRGIGDLLSFLSSTSGLVGQQMEEGRFNRSLASQEQEGEASRRLQSSLAGDQLSESARQFDITNRIKNPGAFGNFYA